MRRLAHKYSWLHSSGLGYNLPQPRWASFRAVCVCPGMQGHRPSPSGGLLRLSRASWTWHERISLTSFMFAQAFDPMHAYASRVGHAPCAQAPRRPPRAPCACAFPASHAGDRHLLPWPWQPFRFTRTQLLPSQPPCSMHGRAGGPHQGQ